MDQYIQMKSGEKCGFEFFYVDGNDLHLVLSMTLVEAADLVSKADLSEIRCVRSGDTVRTVTGYTTVVMLHPQENGTRVGLRRA